MENIEQPKLIAVLLVAENTDFYADSVEWCPLSPYLGHLVCGTYQLDEDGKADDSSQARQGNVTLYQLKANQSSDGDFILKKLDVVKSAGVLDIKWSPQYLNETCVVGVAFSTGRIELFKVDTEKLIPLCSQNLGVEEKKLALSLDWSSWKHQSCPPGIVVSDSSGALNYLQLRNTDLCLLNSWKAHNFESWIAAFDYDDPQVIFSGGDDCCLKGWDLRSLSSPTFISKRHMMGVTSISKCKTGNLVATGSYDENIYLWDTRNFKTSLSEISVHGGIWRLKWHPRYHDYLLSASMHSGFHIVHIKENGFESEPQVSYDKHKSLAYGTDWCYISSHQQSQTHEEVALASQLEHFNFQSVVASCSFYDQLLNIWAVKSNE